MTRKISWNVGFVRLDKSLEGRDSRLMNERPEPPVAPLSEFERWKASCEDQALEPEDFLATLVEATEFPDDAIVVLMSLIWPRFVEFEGKVYLESRFAPEHLQDIPEDHKERPDFWLNLTLLSTWLRDGGKAEWAAKVMSETWKARLAQSFPEYTFAIETLVDGEDTALTFYRHQG